MTLVSTTSITEVSLAGFQKISITYSMEGHVKFIGMDEKVPKVRILKGV